MKKHKDRGTLVIIGGHEDHEGKRVILKRVAELIPDGRLTLATIASHEPNGYLEKYQNALGDLGVTEVRELYVEDRQEANSQDKLQALDAVQALFFSGGDQLRITSQICGTPIYTRVHDIFDAGGLIAGTSAGASVMGELMLVKGERNSSFRIGDLHMAAGLGLLPNVIIDQHFAERGRIGRLIGAVSQNPRMMGIGIDEDNAIVVEGQRFTVIGSGSVYLVDGGGITHSNIAEGGGDEALSVFDLKIHMLASGDVFDLSNGNPQMPPGD